MGSKFVDYLKDPNLVASFQKWFGVYSVSEAREKKFSKARNKTSSVIEGNGRPNILNGKPNSQLRHKTNNTTSCTTVKCDKTKRDKRGFLNDTSQRPSSRKDEQSIDFNGDISSRTTAEESTLSSESDAETLPYVITIKFWYYFFIFGTYLGDEIFYASFIPFWFWNIDGAVGRRVVMVWTIVMYIGQGIKDIICWPRPASPPVFRLQKKWSLEHGMPSTHAMVGIAIPFSVIVYTMHRYQYPVGWGVAFAVCWCVIISLSRIYLGMHSVLDIVVGLVLAIVLMVPVVPLVDVLDMFLLTSRWSPFILISFTIPMIVFYPTTTHWTPTRGDTTMIVSFCVGIYIGAWTNYHMGVMAEPNQPPPYTIIWPSWPMFGTGALRTVIGLCCIVATLAVCKSAQHTIMSCLLCDETSPTVKTQHSRARNTVELTCKYLSYILLGFNILYLMPNVFKMLRIERPTFYTEM